MSLAPKDLEEKRIRAAAEKEQKIKDAKEALEAKRNQHAIELELKRGANGEFDMESFNKTVDEIQSRVGDVDSLSIGCVFAQPAQKK